MRIANIVKDEKFIDGIISLQDMFNGGFEHDYIIIQEGKYNKAKTLKLAIQFFGHLRTFETFRRHVNSKYAI